MFKNSKIVLFICLICISLAILLVFSNHHGNIDEQQQSQRTIITQKNESPKVKEEEEQSPQSNKHQEGKDKDDGDAAPIVASTSNEDVIIPIVYPVHRSLPKRQDLIHGLEAQRRKRCNVKQKLSSSYSPLLIEQQSSLSQTENDEKKSSSSTTKSILEKQFQTKLHEPLFVPKDEEISDESKYYWGAKITNDQEQSQLPCTNEVQQLLKQWQQCSNNNNNVADNNNIRGLVSYLKSGAHGVGSAITLLAHDFLSALLLGRRLVIGTGKKGNNNNKKKWFFAPEGCDEGGWECLFLPATTCFSSEALNSEKVVKIKSISSHQNDFLKHKLITKAVFDLPGLSRNEFPSIEQFFDILTASESVKEKCVTRIKRWADAGGDGDTTDRILMGTFKEASNPILTYQLAQVTAYLMRGVQPWFRQVLQANLRRTLLGNNYNNNNDNDVNINQIVFIHDRGEIAKYREYYNSFGCHKFGQGAYQREMTTFCGSSASSSSSTSCTVFVSGNMPRSEFETFEKRIAAANERKRSMIQIMKKNGKETSKYNYYNLQSTWYLKSSSSSTTATASESQRWGASHPAASWIDLFAGAHSTAWACVIQSNWCRVIAFLRWTITARADCAFVDMGIASLADGEMRQKYCIVKEEWPMKPFSSKIGKNLKLP